eukprot:scaffold76641_cov37-Cyclotella_meneghiniana.AAC.1
MVHAKWPMVRSTATKQHRREHHLNDSPSANAPIELLEKYIMNGFNNRLGYNNNSAGNASPRRPLGNIQNSNLPSTALPALGCRQFPIHPPLHPPRPQQINRALFHRQSNNHRLSNNIVNSNRNPPMPMTNHGVLLPPRLPQPMPNQMNRPTFPPAPRPQPTLIQLQRSPFAPRPMPNQAGQNAFFGHPPRHPMTNPMQHSPLLPRPMPQQTNQLSVTQRQPFNPIVSPFITPFAMATPIGEANRQRRQEQQSNRPITRNENVRPPPPGTSRQNPASKEEIKRLLHLYFSCQSLLRTFCKEHKVTDSVRQQMYREIRKHHELKDLEGKRGESENRNRTIDIIDSILPGPKFRQSSASIPAPTHPDDEFYTPRNLASIAQSLDFSTEPRMKRGEEVVIRIHNQKEPNERSRSLMLFLHKEVVSRHPNLSKFQREKLLEDIACIVMYDQGYKEAKYFKQLTKTWNARLVEYFRTGVQTAPLRTRNSGRRAYTDEMETKYPGYIHKVYRAAEKLVGTQVSFKKLAEVINRLSRGEEFNDKPDLNLTKKQLWRHFKQFRGTMKSPLEKPFKTDKQKAETLEWCRKVKTLKRSLGNKFHICFIDEKWFYTQSRRKKTKHLPRHETEDPDEVQEFVRTTVSRRHPIKVMAMGVVAPPCDANDYNGGIYFKRVSKLKPYQKTTYSTHLSDVARINQELRDGKWKEKLVDNADVETATWGQLREQIGLTYDLDDDVTEVSSSNITVALEEIEGVAKKSQLLNTSVRTITSLVLARLTLSTLNLLLNMRREKNVRLIAVVILIS